MAFTGGCYWTPIEHGIPVAHQVATSIRTESVGFWAVFFVAIPAAARAGATPVSMHQAKRHEYHDEKQDGSERVAHAYSNPAKPMNASDRLPAMISVRPVPLAMAGMSESSDVSRMEAISTSARVRPRPAPTAKTMPWMKP